MDFGVGGMMHDMFVLGVPVWERVIRAILVYAFVIVGLRLAGKREIGALSSFDLVVLLFLSNILQNSIIGNDLSVTGGIIGAATLIGVDYVVQRFLVNLRGFQRVFEGEPTLLVDDGVILHENLKRELLTEQELLIAVHKQGILEIRNVQRALLETDGNISVFPRTPTPGESRDADILRQLTRIEEALARALPPSSPRLAE